MMHGRPALQFPVPPSRIVALLCACVVLVSCTGTGTEPLGPGAPGLSIIDGGAADTIFSRNAITLALRDSAGMPLGGTEIYLQAGLGSAFELDGVVRGVMPITTTADGRLRVILIRGGTAGTLWLSGFRVDHGRVDSVSTEVLAGAPARIAPSPADTALYMNATIAFDVRVFDQNWNPRPERGAPSATSAGLRIEQGQVKATIDAGREWVMVKYGTITDTARISVVPRGEIASRSARFIEPDYSAHYRVVRFNLDGSAYRPVASGSAPLVESFRALSWSPAGDHLLGVAEEKIFSSAIYRMSLDGTMTQLFRPPAPTFDVSPAYSRDMSWVYFSRSPRGSSQEIDLYRAKPDGSGVQRLSPDATQWFYEDWFSAPSPDGRYLAYATNRDRSFDAGRLGDAYLRVIDLQTGAVVKLFHEAFGVSWSPDGQWIAFAGASSGVYIVHPDGTGLRRISQRPFDARLSWSPDGKWIIAGANSGQALFYVLGVERALELPLPYTEWMHQPAWRPLP